MMDDRYNVTEERVRAETTAPRSLFGPPTARELLQVPWDWRREIAKTLLLLAEGLWMLAWTILFIELVEPDYPHLGALVGGWIMLALLALLSAHVVMRVQEIFGWARVRLVLGVLIVLSTGLYLASVSGGPAQFLAEVSAVFRLRPGPGFWALWLGILAWSRGFDWSQQLLGTGRARHTLLYGLALLALLALVRQVGGRDGSMLLVIGSLWLFGLVSLGLSRLVLEDFMLWVSRPLRLALKQAALLAVATGVTLLVARGVMALLEAERRARISRYILDITAEPRRQLAILLTNLFVLFVTLMWHLFFWIATSIVNFLGISFNPVPTPPQPDDGAVDFADAFFAWLATVLTAEILFWIRLVLFTLFALVILFYLLTKLDRLQYLRNAMGREEPESEAEPGRLRLLIRRIPRPRFSRRRAAPEPEDVVRRIYVRLVRLGAARGAVWRAPATPYEHEPALRRALPGRESDIHLITEQYVRVRYAGEAPVPTELDALREAWERVRGSTAAG